MAPTDVPEAAARATGARRLLVPAAWPWWVQALAIFALTRVWSTAVLVWAARGQPESVWAGAAPGYWTFVGRFWDAAWYQAIAENGYPASLPTGAGGEVLQNSWAFFPLFPLLGRLLVTITGAPWEVVAPVTATLLAAGAVVVVAHLVEGQARARGYARARSLALGTVLLIGIFPSGVVLQVAYTESLSLLLIALSLWLLVRRSYGWTALAVLALGLTRAVALPMAAVVAVHLVSRWRAHRSGRDVLSRRDAAAIGALGACAVLAGVAWPLVSGLVTGQLDAYVRTQAAWRGSFSSAPVVPWIQMAQYVFGPTGIVVLLVVVVVVVALGASRAAGLAGPEVRAWGLAYPAWLLLAVFPQSSVLRFLLLAFPLGMATIGLAPSRFRVALVVAASAAGQYVWVVWLWQITTPTAWPP